MIDKCLQRACYSTAAYYNRF